MANGYLGKISAIVSANTADFGGKLSKSAKEVSAFARNVQSNLTSASRQAARSLEGIYTPLQKFERSLQAAATMKLSFKGFPGMIKDLDGLQQRLNSVLSKRQVDIVLKTTGMKSVTDVRDALYGLKSKDIEIITRFGGLDKLKELGGKIEADVDIGESRKRLADLTAAADAARAKVAAIGSGAVTVKVNAESVDTLTTQLDAARAAAGKLMGGEFMGQKSLNKAISGVSSELVKVEAELSRAAAAKKTLETMSSGPRSKPAELDAANARVSSLAAQKEALDKKLADLEKYRDTIKTVMREIKQAEAGGGAAASGGDIATARKEEAAAIRAVSLATKDLQKQLSAKFGVDIDITSFTALIEKANTAGGVINNLGELIDSLGKSDFDAAADSMRKLQSASSQIFEPLAASVKKLAGLGVELQAPFHDALKGTQADVERLKVAIDAVGDDGPNPELLAFFDEVQAKSSGATRTIDRLLEVSGRLGQLKTGGEFVFEQPRLNEAINKSGTVGNQAAALPAEVLRTNPAIAQSLVEIRRLSDEAGVAYAKFLAVKDQKQPTGEAQKELDAVVGKLLEAQAASDRLMASSKLRADEAAREAVEIGVSLASLQAAGAVAGQYAAARRVVADEAAREAVEIGVSLDALKKSASLIPRRSDLYDNRRTELKFAVTGSFSNADQIEAEVSRVTADIQKLDAAQKVAFGKRATLVIDLLGENKIQDAAIEAKNLRSDLDQQIELKVKTDAAQKAVDDLKAKMDQVREQNAFVVTGRPQNITQAESRESGLRGEIGGLKGGQRGKFRGLLEDAAVARETGDLVKYNDALDKIDAKLGKAKRFNVRTAEAKKNLDDLKATMDLLRAESNFVISAKVQNAGQAEAEIKRIVGGMEQLDAAQRTALQPKVDAAISSLGTKNIAVISAAVKDLDDEFEKERVVKVRADEAKKNVESLKESLGSIADRIGDPSQPIDRLRKAVEAANAAIAKMPAGAIRAKLEGDLNAEKVRIEAAARPGAPAPSAAGINAAAARANAIASAAAAATPAKTTANPLGANFGTAERSIAALQSNVIALQGSLEKLPVPMQAQFIPAINKVRDAFAKLTPASTTAEIDAVIKKAAGLERVFTRAGQAAKFGGTLGEALNAAAITKTEKQLGFVRAKLLEVGATASGPVASAFNAYSAAAAAAAKAGVSGTAATTKQLDGLIAKIGEALVAEGKLTAAQGKAFSKSVGDVGRAGADKFALALNQAAFAVDDFLSSTGGLEFKLRAISNNITQLAFILGGTTGLFVGLGAVIAGQAAVGLIKWINNGRSAEDQTKALNESLARQKSLVEELAQAFRSLGDAVSRGTFSAGGEQAAEFARQVSDIKKKQQESRESRVADIDPAVQRERAEQNKRRKQLESETDIGRRIAIQKEIRASEDRERDAKAAAVGRKVSPDEARTRIRESIERVGMAALGPRRGDDAGRAAAEQAVRVRAEAATEGVPDGATPEAIRAQMAALEKQIKSLSATAAEGSPLGFSTSEVASKESLTLERLLRSLEQPLAAAIDKAAIDIAEASRGPAAQIRQAQEDVAEAIRKGVPGAAAFQRELDANAKKLSDAYSSLEEAQKETDSTKKQAKVDEAQKNIAEVQAEKENIRNQSREVRLGRTFGGGRTAAALSSLDGNERFNNDSARTRTYLAVVIDREIEARQELEAATAKGVEAEIKAAEAKLDAAQKASEAAAAFAEAAIAIESALTRIRKVGESAFQKSEQGADAAQKAFEDNPLRAGGLESRDAAERRLIDDRAQVANAQDNLDNRRREIRFDPQMENVNGELEAITQRRKDLEAKSRTVEQLNPAERQELDAARKREIELMRQREHLVRDLTEAERKQLDAINNGIAAREKELENSRRRAAEDPAFKRRMEGTNQIIADSERQASEAQQRYINNPTEKNRKERDEADARLREDRQRAQGLQDDLDNKRKEIEKDPRVAANNKTIAANDQKLAELAEKEATVGLTQAEKDFRDALQEANRELRGENEAVISAGTKPEQDAIDKEQIAQNQRDRALRGRDLGMTEQERRRKDFEEGAGADINARAKELRDQGVDPSSFLKQAFKNQSEQVAPMLQQIQSDRENALLQGPSRAALNVSDVSTSQGQSELNRLLRGDDSAKNINLAELRKQSQALLDIKKAIEASNPGVLL